ncbi:hypothetical protein [Kocuria rosea]|uniref:hypothetical protein n=1 Tax=Kocuria rosea TaxID=1275 RepID=UPI003018E36B
MVLCIIVPLVLHDATGGWNNTRNPWWALATIVVSGAAYAGVIASRERQLFAMVLWLFTYLFMGLAPYAQYRLDAKLSTIPYIDGDLYPAAGILVLVCSAAVGIGAFLANRTRTPTRALRPTTVNRRRADVLTMAALGLFAYYGNATGFGSFLLTRTEQSLAGSVWGDSATGALLGGAMRMGLLVAFLAQMALRQQAKAAGRRPRLLPALVIGAVLLFAVNPIGSARYTFGTVALAMLAALGAYATMHRFRAMAALALLGMLFVFPLADVFRHTRDAAIEVEGPVTALTSGDFDAFSQLTNTFDYVGEQGITYGGQLLGVLLLWVPRSLWQAKPEDTGIVLAEHMGYQFTNLSAPLWAELLINFGIVGAVLGMGYIGYLFRRWDARTELHLRHYPMPPVMVSAVAFYLLILLRGSLLAVSANLLVIIVLALFVTRKTGLPHR